MPRTSLDFDALRQCADFGTVLSHYGLTARGHGEQIFVLCPFHVERTPSCSINCTRNIFHCFGCGAKGTIIDFVAKLERTDLWAAAFRLAEICSLSLDAPNARLAATTGAPRAPPGRKALHQPMAPLLLNPAHPYLSERNLPDDAIQIFGIGYCDRGPLCHRICIPIHDVSGELVAYAGRWSGDPVPLRVPRYLVSSGFQKHRHLYNLHRVGPHEHIVIVEGYWSVFRLHMLGIPAVSLMGSSISAEQVELLREQQVEFVSVLMDGDEAGYAARDRLVQILCGEFHVRAPQLPRGLKPDTVPEGMLWKLVAFRG